MVSPLTKEEPDGLHEYMVFAERDYPNNSYRITKIEPFNPDQAYPRNCVGVVRAKDELDAWRFVRMWDSDFYSLLPDRYDSSRREDRHNEQGR